MSEKLFSGLGKTITKLSLTGSDRIQGFLRGGKVLGEVVECGEKLGPNKVSLGV